MEPLPEPEAPLVTVSHEALLLAVQAQPVGDVIVKLDEALAEATEVDVGDSVKVHDAAAWVTVKVWPPAVIVALRLEVDVLLATL